MSTPVTKPTAVPSGPKTIKVRLNWREAVDAAMRLRTDHRGHRYVNRFATAKVIEHFVVTLAFIALGITGFTQTYYDSRLGTSVLAFFGGIDAVRQVHHVFAFILGFTFIYHIFNYLNDVFVYRRNGRMWFIRDDLAMLVRLGGSKKPVRFDRYTLSEKISYWVLGVCIAVIGASGLIQAFPIAAVRYFPGIIIPSARLFHFWIAVLAVLTVVVWHLYDTVVRKFNLSIFSGNMSLKNMREDHPLELEYLEKAAAVANSTKWPVTIEITQEEAQAAVPAEKAPEAEEQAARPEPEAKQEHPIAKEETVK